MIKLKPGDIVYYSPNLALGFLLDNFTDVNGDVVWNYLLRSPRRSDLTKHLISKQQVHESKLIDAIANDRFQYYNAKTT